jgi:HEAT repeat protein
VARSPSDTLIFAGAKHPRRCLFKRAEKDLEPIIRVSLAAERLQQSRLTMLAPLSFDESSARLELVAILANLKTTAACDCLAAISNYADTDTRVAACVVLIQYGDSRGLSGLAAVLRQSWVPVRQSAAEMLGRTGAPSALPVLLQLLTDSSYEVRYTAAAALGRLGTPEAIPVLLDLVQRESFQYGQAQAQLAGALARLSEPVDTTTAALWLKSGDAALQLRGASALFRQGDRSGRGMLRRMIEQSSSPYPELAAAVLTSGTGSVELEVIQWLAKSHIEEVRIQAAVALCMSSEEAAFATVMEMLGPDSPGVKSAIVNSLAFSPNPAAYQALLEISESRDSLSLSVEAVRSLARRGEPLAFETVLGWAGSHQPFFRQAAAQWLACGHDLPDALDQLLTLSEASEGIEIRANAAASLGEFDDPRAFSVLLQMIKSGAWQERLGAALGMEVMGKRAADRLVDLIGSTTEEKELIPLIELLGRTESSSRNRQVILERGLADPTIWIRVAGEATEAGDRSTRQGVVAALSSKDVRIRQTAARTLGAIGDEQTISPLVSLLSDSDWEVRLNAAQSLERVSAAAPERLLDGLRARHPSVRAGVANLLGRLQNSESFDALMSGLSDQNRIVRANIADALGMLDDARAVTPLIQALTDADRGVRNMAAAALRKIGAPEGLAAVRSWTFERRTAVEEK